MGEVPEDLDAMGPQELTQFIRPPDQVMQDPTERLTHMSTGQVLQYEPMTPLEVSFMLEECQAAMDRYAQVYPLILAEVYETERAYILKKSQARLTAPGGGYDRDRAAYADAESIKELEAWHLAKEKRNSADALVKALQSKMFMGMNLNKVMATLFNSGQGGGPSYRG